MDLVRALFTRVATCEATVPSAIASGLSGGVCERYLQGFRMSLVKVHRTTGGSFRALFARVAACEATVPSAISLGFSGGASDRYLRWFHHELIVQHFW